ncbi:hypothetical protein IGI04_014650 [Brassica rapa subsp. trilocularis]|uniref:Uncharacterized protein n=1 Tax=Brassica rapa subsp. trilocularis TaxID=1813537 RepID=A0ABQ7MMT0_BRACM|nr:hypothetical protein IGI04_014650 [Brassica rapa subsp. trilocularis]
MNNQFEALNAPKIEVIEANDSEWVTFTTYLGSRLAIDDLPGSRLAIDDLPGSLLVNAETTYNSVVRSTTYLKLLKYIQRHLLPDGLPVSFVKRVGKLHPKSMTFNVLQSEGATITCSALRYSNGLSRICVWLQCVLNLLFVKERALNKQIRDHCDKMLHYLIDFFRANMRDNVVPDEDVPLKDRYPYSNPMLVLEVHRCIDIIHIHPSNLLRFSKRRYHACMIIPRPTS